jgi:hypothetical protein
MQLAGEVDQGHILDQKQSSPAGCLMRLDRVYIDGFKNP